VKSCEFGVDSSVFLLSGPWHIVIVIVIVLILVLVLGRSDVLLWPASGRGHGIDTGMNIYS
jgi:hypothetical protein